MAGRTIARGQRRDVVIQRAQKRSKSARIGGRMACIAGIAGPQGGNVECRLRFYSRLLSQMAGAAGTCDNRGVVIGRSEECTSVMAYAAIGRRRDMCHRLADDPGKLSAMAGCAIAGQAGVIHSPAQEGIGAGMAGFARQQSRKVVGRFADDAERLSIVAGDTAIRDGDIGHAHVIEALHQETGRARVAGIAGLGGLHMIHGFGSGADAASNGVTAAAVFRGVLEDAIDVALFAPQRGMYVAQQESGFGMVERGGISWRLHRAGHGLRLGGLCKAGQQAKQQGNCRFMDTAAHHAHLCLPWFPQVQTV